MKISVLIASHNRRKKTLECIQRLQIAADYAGEKYQLILFDDGSIDGTSESVLEMEPDAIVIKGDGSFFWNRSMHAAFDRALKGGYSDYLWLNDDTMLEPEAIQVINDALVLSDKRDTIVVGAVKDPISGNISYGGGQRKHPLLRPFHYAMVEPVGKIEDVDLINGNVVWIPDSAARQVGNLDPYFEHGIGDMDYALRARRIGIRIVQTAKFIGSCPRNTKKGSHKDRQLPLFIRLQKIFATRKGLPWRSWLIFCVRHGSILWPFHFIWPYVKVILNRS